MTRLSSFVGTAQALRSPTPRPRADRLVDYLDYMLMLNSTACDPAEQRASSASIREAYRIEITAEDRRQYAPVLRDQGLSMRTIADILGTSVATIQRLLTSDHPALTACHVYAIQSGTDGPIKVGKTYSPDTRLAQLQTSSAYPLTLLGAVPETPELSEASEHARLASRRMSGEWFDITPADLPWLEA